ncbi:hypothetical protein PN498_28415 [Oscillatoria sp. CS-180]|uniref:hypothetical protein n=1 Tax=Oscillatoria sp. CS-180 TaxID=3021720 RepID=UPI00232C8D06|nr:hypothetical protein [Oscillatoria sp. CS-180]MDB9529944.1 hypothetical protein [Oscillatoria sp. CS-180]
MATTTDSGSGIETPEFQQVCEAVRQGCNVLVLGEAGNNADFPKLLYRQFEGRLNVAIAKYKGSGKLFFQKMAEALDIPTTEDKYDREGNVTGEKPMSMDAIKDELLMNIGPDTLLILPEAKRLSSSIRYWLEDAIAAGCRMVLFSPVNPGRDIFLDLLEIELELPTDQAIREVMADEAKRRGLQLSRSELAELQPLAGRNPMLARKVVRQRRLGLKHQRPEHTQYIVIMPILVACLMAFGVVRFVGMGTKNKSLYIFGGTALITGMTLKQLGSVRGARKRFGQ